MSGGLVSRIYCVGLEKALTHDSTFVCHQRGQGFHLVDRHLGAVTDTWKNTT